MKPGRPGLVPGLAAGPWSISMVRPGSRGSEVSTGRHHCRLHWPQRCAPQFHPRYPILQWDCVVGLWHFLTNFKLSNSSPTHNWAINPSVIRYWLQKFGIPKPDLDHPELIIINDGSWWHLQPTHAAPNPCVPVTGLMRPSCVRHPRIFPVDSSRPVPVPTGQRRDSDSWGPFKLVRNGCSFMKA